MADALAAAKMSKTELEQASKYKRGTIGALCRGEVQRADPEVVNEVCGKLGIPVALMLEAFGFNLAITDQQRVPTRLAAAIAAWPGRRRRSLEDILGVLATDDQDEPGQAL